MNRSMYVTLVETLVLRAVRSVGDCAKAAATVTNRFAVPHVPREAGEEDEPCEFRPFSHTCAGCARGCGAPTGAWSAARVVVLVRLGQGNLGGVAIGVP